MISKFSYFCCNKQSILQNTYFIENNVLYTYGRQTSIYFPFSVVFMFKNVCSSWSNQFWGRSIKIFHCDWLFNFLIIFSIFYWMCSCIMLFGSYKFYIFHQIKIALLFNKYFALCRASLLWKKGAYCSSCITFPLILINLSIFLFVPCQFMFPNIYIYTLRLFL